MGTRRHFRSLLACQAILLLAVSSAPAQTTVELQKQFDRESDSVRKAKLLVKLGDAQFDETRSGGKARDNNTVGYTLEKYRDNVRAALAALKKQHPDAAKHSNGYRQLEMHVGKGIREVEEAMAAAPEPYKPPLTIVLGDLMAMDEELIRLLFPQRPADHPPKPSTEKQP